MRLSTSKAAATGVVFGRMRGAGRLGRPVVLVATAFAVVLMLGAGSAVASGTTELVSVSSAGVQGDNASFPASVSADGRYVAFASQADNLVPGDTNGAEDVFVRDRLTGTTTRVSVSSSGAQANGDSVNPVISADGNVVAFDSTASNLVAGDTNGSEDIFVHDLVTGATERVSVSSSGTQQTCGGVTCGDQIAVSADGRFVAFTSIASNLVPGDTNNSQDVFVRDRLTGRTGRVSVPNGQGGQANTDCENPSISANGRFVAFDSYASNLVPGDTNGQGDVFVRDRSKARTGRISISNNRSQGNLFSEMPAISGNGRYVAFYSGASNLVRGDTNHTGDVFLRDRARATTTRISVSSTGAQANAGSNLTTLSISYDGRYIAFDSQATNLVPGDTNGKGDIFVRDQATHTTGRVSVSSTGTQARYFSAGEAIASDGGYVVFTSYAGNLAPNDTNHATDVFIHHPLP